MTAATAEATPEVSPTRLLTTGSLVRCFDAKFPPLNTPEGYHAVLGYIGGPRAANIWTLTEWQRFANLYQFPCYVPDIYEDPIPQAKDACEEAGRRGWIDGLKRAIIADTETSVDREWWAQFATNVLQGGYVPVDYGSLSYALANAAELVWSALWDDIAEIQPGQTIVADQYQAGIQVPGGLIDASVLHPEFLKLAGRGTRH